MFHLLKISLFFVLLFFTTGIHGRYRNTLIAQYSPKLKSRNCIHNICENVHDYPEDLIERIVAEKRGMNSYFGKVLNPSNHTVYIGTRSSETVSSPLCVIEESTLVPRQIPNTLGEKKFIVNTKEFVQVITVQICHSLGSECDSDIGSWGYKSRCEQHFTIVKLLRVDVDEGKAGYEEFRIPSTCVCKIGEKGF